MVDSGTTASDLTVVAVEKMIAELGWEKKVLTCWYMFANHVTI